MRSIPEIHHNNSLRVLRRTFEFRLRVLFGIAIAASAAPVYAAGRGDSDEDGDIDLRDFANLQQCIPEPEDPPPFGDCLVFDFNGDEVVDQSDFDAMYDTPLGPVVIPPGALMQDSEIGVTSLITRRAIRHRLPQLIGSQGRFVDIAGVFAERTNKPITMQMPNRYNLPIGTEVRFGKADHNSPDWMDLAEEGGDTGVGVVKPDPDGGTMIEVQFDHFCRICAGYCLPYPSPRSTGGGGGGSGGGAGGGAGGSGGGNCGDSSVTYCGGFLTEEIALPGFQERGRPWGLSLAYHSTAAAPSVTLRGQIDYGSERPVERTVFTFNIEGVTVEAAYDLSEDNQLQYGTFFRNGRNGLGERMPTGSYPYSIFATLHLPG